MCPISRIRGLKIDTDSFVRRRCGDRKISRYPAFLDAYFSYRPVTIHGAYRQVSYLASSATSQVTRLSVRYLGRSGPDAPSTSAGSVQQSSRPALVHALVHALVRRAGAASLR